jgi:hypothetical protein
MRSHAWSRAGAVLIVTAAVGLAVRASAQSGLSSAQYRSGQNVAPVFEGWLKNADGSYDFVFGYLNRNYEEQPEIPIGPANAFSPGMPDRGQPTHFYPRRQQFMFKVRVPADFGKQELTWTLTRGGRTDTAVAHLALEWELTEVVYSQNRRGLANDAVKAVPNQPPTVAIDGGPATTAVGTPLTLTALASDDGNPKPPPPAGEGRGRGAVAEPPPLITTRFGPVQQQIVQPNRGGLAVTWTHWRGPGRVTFEPATALVKDGKVSTRATFSEPGTYVVRAYADDGAWFEPADVTVTVRTASGPSGR